MPKKGHSEEQIIAALKQYEAGDKTADICRKLGISQATFYMWKRQYAGLSIQELRELRSLREENLRHDTNDVDALDPALLRPGRIDYKLFMGRAAESQKAELYRRFFPEASEEAALEFARKHRAETMAEFQGHLLALEQEFAELESLIRS